MLAILKAIDKLAIEWPSANVANGFEEFGVIDLSCHDRDSRG
jgi:hypothetical protein